MSLCYVQHCWNVTHTSPAGSMRRSCCADEMPWGGGLMHAWTVHIAHDFRLYSGYETQNFWHLETLSISCVVLSLFVNLFTSLSCVFAESGTKRKRESKQSKRNRKSRACKSPIPVDDDVTNNSQSSDNDIIVTASSCKSCLLMPNICGRFTLFPWYYVVST